MRRMWLVYCVGAVAVIGTDLCEALFPKLTQMTIDIFNNSLPDVARQAHKIGLNFDGATKFEAFQVIFALMLALIFVQFLGRIGWRVTLAQQTHYVAAKFKKIIWNRARYFPRSRLEGDLSSGELMNVATGDVGTGRFVYGFTLTAMADFVFLLIFTATAMFSIDVELTLWSLAILPVLPIFLDRLARRESRAHAVAQESLSKLTDLAAQAVATVRLQRLTQTGPFWEGKLNDSADEYRLKRLSVIRAGLAYIPTTGYAPIVSYVILLGLGLKKVFLHEMSVGSFVAMQSYIFIIQGPLFDLGMIISEWQRCFTSLERISHVLRQAEAPQLREGGARIAPSPMVFEVKGLGFRHPNAQGPVLKDLNFSLGQSERLGVRGPIGSGKSTLVNILSGFERNFEGELRLFGRDIRDYSHKELRQYISIVPQKSFLFADTIRANLRLNRELSDDEIWRLLEITCLKEDVERFPYGLETRLGEWGINLSGGQKQRLTLARALVNHPRILFLDDCLSAVDTVTEEKILANLDLEMKQLTAIWVAHRGSTLRYCDQIIDLEPL
jgi:ATP-binding cassette subfamily B protein